MELYTLEDLEMKDSNLERGASVVSLLVAVCIASIAFVAYYKVMFHFQQSEQPRIEKIKLEQSLINWSEQLHYEVSISSDPIESVDDLINYLEYFQSVEVDYEDGTYTWEIEDSTWSLSPIEGTWLSVSLQKDDVRESLYWSYHVGQ